MDGSAVGGGDDRAAPQVLGFEFLADVRKYQATYFNYIGKALAYVLTTPPQPDDADNPLIRGFGNEAADIDIRTFQRRFACSIKDGYGSTEGGMSVNRVPGMPEGAWVSRRQASR